MEEDIISISLLNDFIFCPYSIYLHNVYADVDEDLYHAPPQVKGKIVHESIDRKTASTKAEDLIDMPVFSERFGLAGKIDIYKCATQHLIERKYQLKNIYRGQVYQLWAQMFCLEEMGYPVRRLSFYEISTNRTIGVDMPTEEETDEFARFIQRFHTYSPQDTIEVNDNKCRHCIYCSLCDKTTIDNVYQ